MLKDGIRGSTVVLTAAICLVLGAGGTAIGAKLITGKDIKDGTVTTKDIKNGTVTTKDVKNDTLKSEDVRQGTLTSGDVKNESLKGVDIKDGSIGAGDLSEAAKASVYSGPNWGVVDRNVIGNGDAYLRAGPVVLDPEDLSAPALEPPYGIGSLGIRTGSATDKTSFGNQVDFVGTPLADLDQLGFWVMTTQENIDISPTNLPNLQFELDAGLTPGPAVDFTTANFVPPAQLFGWHEIDAATEGEWFLTGTEGDETGCNQTTTCSLAELQAAIPDALIGTVLFNKGSDNAFSGAVDGLQINDEVFDFEPLGVVTTTPVP